MSEGFNKNKYFNLKMEKFGGIEAERMKLEILDILGCTVDNLQSRDRIFTALTSLTVLKFKAETSSCDFSCPLNNFFKNIKYFGLV